MKTSLDQYCINVSDLERSVAFYEKVLGLEVTHRIEIPDGPTPVSEVVLAGDGGNRIQLAWHHDHEGPINHGNAFWKLYIKTDDCKGLYQRAIDAGSPSTRPPERLEAWPVTAAFIEDPDGYQVEILEYHEE